MSKKKTVIKVDNLIKKYGDFTAVDGISFEVSEGEIFGLLGPNGAGKTTTLEIMETLKDETSGEVEILGMSINKDYMKIKSKIGVQLQQAGFYPGLKLDELLNQFAALYDVSVDVDKLLGEVSLLDKKKSQVKDLSGGQKQRFSIATTLINKPDVIFLDEPTTGLDPQARRNLWELIRRIRDDNTTVVITTHYMDEAEYLCDRIGIMDKGEIIALETPTKLIEGLLSKGFTKDKKDNGANLEDVFIDLTGNELRD